MFSETKKEPTDSRDGRKSSVELENKQYIRYIILCNI